MNLNWLVNSIRGSYEIEEYDRIQKIAKKELTFLAEVLMIFPPINRPDLVIVVVPLAGTLYGFFTFLMTLTCILTREDFVIWSETIHHTIVIYLSMFIQIVFSMRRPDLLEIIRDQMNGVFKYETGNVDETLLKKMREDGKKFEKKLLALPLLTLAVGGTALGLKPIIDSLMNVSPNPLLIEKGIAFNSLIPTYFPFSMKKLEVVATMNFLFAIFGGICVTAIVVADLLFIKITSWITWEFSVLIESLNAIERRAKQLYEIKIGFTRSSTKTWREDPFYQDCIENCLKENIRHHHQIMRLHKQFSRVASPAVGAAFFALTITMGLGMIILNMKSINLGDLLAFCNALAAELLSVFLISWISERIGKLNEDLFNAVYSIRWFVMRNNIKKMVIIFLNGTRKPLFLRTFGMTTTNMEAFGSVLNTSYSFLNLVKASEARDK